MSAAQPAEILSVVLDTNVYISAFLRPGGIPSQIWELAIRRRYRLFVSPGIMRELAEVLRADLHWEDVEVVRQLKLIAKTARLVVPAMKLDVVTADPTIIRFWNVPLLAKPI